MSLLLVWRHSANIGKLLAGTESKLGQQGRCAPRRPQAADIARTRGHKHSHDAAHAERKKARAHREARR